MISVNVETFVIQRIPGKQFSKLFKGSFLELSNLRRKIALSTNFDSSFTYYVLSQQNSISVGYVLWPFWLRKSSAWESKAAFNPLLSLLLLLLARMNFEKKIQPKRVLPKFKSWSKKLLIELTHTLLILRAILNRKIPIVGKMQHRCRSWIVRSKKIVAENCHFWKFSANWFGDSTVLVVFWVD